MGAREIASGFHVLIPFVHAYTPRLHQHVEHLVQHVITVLQGHDPGTQIEPAPVACKDRRDPQQKKQSRQQGKCNVDAYDRVSSAFLI